MFNRLRQWLALGRDLSAALHDEWYPSIRYAMKGAELRHYRKSVMRERILEGLRKGSEAALSHNEQLRGWLVAGLIPAERKEQTERQIDYNSAFIARTGDLVDGLNSWLGTP